MNEIDIPRSARRARPAPGSQGAQLSHPAHPPAQPHRAVDPLLGWVGLDPAGRVTAIGGALSLEGHLRSGQLLGDVLVDAAGLHAYLESLDSAASLAVSSAVPSVGTSAETAAETAAETSAETAARPSVRASVGPAFLAAAQRVPARLSAQWKGETFAGIAQPGPDAAPFDLLLRARVSAAGDLRIAAEFWRAGATAPSRGAGVAVAPGQSMLLDRSPEVMGALLAPDPIEAGRALAADVWLLGTALYAATVAPVASRPVGLIRFALHPVALPRLRAVDDLDPWMAIALERLAVTANALGLEAVAARTGVRELTVWVRDGSACARLCEQWLAAVQAAPLVGRERRLVVGPAAAWCVIPSDGQVLALVLDALDAVYEPSGRGPRRPPIAVSSLARERDIDERRGPLTDTLVELARSDRARLTASPVVDAVTGLACGLHLRAEFRSLFAVADLVDYLPDLIDEDGAADALNAWTAQTLMAAPLQRSGAHDLPQCLQLRIGPAQLARIDSLAALVAAARAAGGGAEVCLMLPEAAVHRNAYLVIDASAEVTALGASLGIDDYRGLLPPAQLAQAGIQQLRLHVSLVRDLDERRFARQRLADLLARARRCGQSVVVAGLIRSAQLDAANAVGALQLAGPLFGRAQRLAGAGGMR